MDQQHSHNHNHSRTDDRFNDHAFTLVEILVVLLIVMMLMAVGFLGIGAARNTGNREIAVSTAQAYADAADRFSREHDGRYPRALGGNDWGSGREMDRGPRADALGEIRYYLPSTPEPVQDGRVTIGRAGPARIDYAPTAGGGGYVITIKTDDDRTCAIVGGDATSSETACSKR